MDGSLGNRFRGYAGDAEISSYIRAGNFNGLISKEERDIYSYECTQTALTV
jgi:hypothetical protein